MKTRKKDALDEYPSEVKMKKIRVSEKGQNIVELALVTVFVAIIVFGAVTVITNAMSPASPVEAPDIVIDKPAVIPTATIIAQDYVDQNRPGNDWKPPAKSYCKVDMVRFYALMYLDEAFAVLVRGVSPEAALSSTLITTSEPLTDELRAMVTQMKNQGCYFYQKGGSVFGDFKYMRNEYFKIQGAGPDWIRTNLNLGMTGDEALTKIIQLVSSWAW